MLTRLAFTALYETVEDGWTQARVAEMPAVITAAPTLAEAKELLLDALREYLLSFATEPEDTRTFGEPLEIVISAA